MNYPKKTVWSLVTILLVLLALVPMRASAENSKQDALQAEMDAILVKYLGTADLTNNEVIDKVSAMTWDEMEAALADRDALEPLMAELSPEELALLEDNYAHTDTIVCFYETIELSRIPAFYAASGTHTPVTGVTVSVSGATDNSMTDGAVTVTAQGSAGIFGFGASAKTATITVTNDSGATAKIAFDWAATSVNELKIDGTKYTGSSGSFSKLMDTGTSFTITITTAKNSTVNKLVMSNFSVTAAAASSKVTILFDSSLGSVTAAGSAATSGAEYDVSLADGITLTATPKSNVTFLAWINENTHEKVEFSGTYKPDSDITLRAVFTSAATDAWFLVNNTLLYNNLNQAATKAATLSNKVVVLAANGTLSATADNPDTANVTETVYTIPAGVTLLIPFDDANTVITDTPVTHECGTTYDTPTVYRTLTMASGAKIAVNGSMSVAAKTAAPGAGYHFPNGGACGPVGHVVMNEGSSITVNGGLYCYGYITGSGTITAKSGAVVYERFEIADFRGGGASSYMNDNSETYKVFPLSQYYIQNIEVPLTLEWGAKEYAWTAIKLSFGLKTSKLQMVGNDETFMFGLSSGSVTKRYDPASDRQIYDVNGNMTLNSISITLDAGLIGNVTINSANFMLPITNSMTINIHSDTATVKQALALLPEAQLTIDSGAKVILSADVHVYDLDQWGAYIYQNSSNPTATMRQARWRPGGMATRTLANDASIVVDGELDATSGKLYTTAGGAAITSTGAGKVSVVVGTDEIAYQGGKVYSVDALIGSSYEVEYHEIPITSAKLLNGDDSIVETANGGANIYNYINGYWRCGTHSYGEGVRTTAPSCTVPGVMTYTCGVCQHTYTASIDPGHSYDAEGMCEVCGVKETDLFGFYASNIKAGDGLEIFFYVDKDYIPSGSTYTAVITRIYSDGRTPITDTRTISSSEWSSYDGYYRFCFNGIAAKEMADEVYVVIQDSSGKAVSKICVESVQRYALRVLSKTQDTKLQKALVDMLNYGAACQLHFDYNTEDLATTGLTEEQKEWASESTTYDSDGSDPGKNFGFASVSATNKLKLTFYFSDITTGMTANISYTDHYGNQVNKAIPVVTTNSHTNNDKTYYGVDVEGLAIADGRQAVTCQIVNGSNEIVAYGTYSVECFVANNKPSNDSVYVYLMKFVDSAYAYFHAEQ